MFHIHSFIHSFIHSTRQPRYINTHPSLFAGSYFPWLPPESKYTTQTLQWKGMSNLFDNSNRPWCLSARCSREKSNSSHHNVSTKERKIQRNTKTLLLGRGGSQLFADFLSLREILEPNRSQQLEMSVRTVQS
jgi:hypothetical protein